MPPERAGGGGPAWLFIEVEWFVAVVVEVKSISCRSQVLSIITAISQVRTSEQGCGSWGLILDGRYPWCPPTQPSS